MEMSTVFPHEEFWLCDVTKETVHSHPSTVSNTSLSQPVPLLASLTVRRQ
jgi:hypothetical protein